MTRLSRERSAELRALVEQDHGRYPNMRRDLLSVLDAYEAQRPRKASEPPKRSCRVILRHDREPDQWESGGYDPDELYGARRWYGDCAGWLTDDRVLEWLPAPEVDALDPEGAA